MRKRMRPIHARGRRRGRSRPSRPRRPEPPRARPIAADAARSSCASATCCRSPAISPRTAPTSTVPSSRPSGCRTPPSRRQDSRRASVQLVGSEDGQTQASASVEAATKLIKANKATVIIGEMASGATIPMAQSVTIPNKVVLDLADRERAADLRPEGQRARLPGVSVRRAPEQGARDYRLAKFGRGANAQRRRAKRRVRIRTAGAFHRRVEEARRDASGRASRGILTRRTSTPTPRSSWTAIRPDGSSSTSPTRSRSSRRRSFAAASGARPRPWRSRLSATPVCSTRSAIPVKGLSGSAGSAAGGPVGKAFAALWKKTVKGAKPFTGFEGTSFDAAMIAFLAAVRGCSSSPAKIKANLRAISGAARASR